MPYITARDNVKIYFEISGNGSPVVLIPGLASDHTTWGQFKTLLENHYTVVTIDNRGAGKSEAPKSNYSVESMAEDVNSVLSEFKNSSFNIIGHSLGSCIAQCYASWYPEKVNSLVLIATRSVSSSILKQHYEVTLSLLKEKINKEILIKNSMCLSFSEKFMRDDVLVNNYVKNTLTRPYPVSLEGLLGQMHAVNNFNNSDYKSDTKIRTCLIHGDEDKISPLSQLKSFKQKNSNYIHVLPCIGHMPHVEEPTQTFSIIESFIAGNNGGK